MSGVPNVFGSATSSIPLSQLDVNFNTPVTIGNTTVGLGNTVTSFGNVTLTNTTVTVGNVTTDLTVHGLTVGLGNSSVATNTVLGISALAANTTGAYNTAVGYQAGYSNTTGIINAFGASALYSNTTGVRNAAFGAFTLFANTTGSYNSAFGGYDAAFIPPMYYNTTGSYNTAMGNGALAFNTTAYNNTAVGYQALYAANRTSDVNGNNTAIGYQAMYTTTTGATNTTIGYQAGYSIGTGSNNVYVGRADASVQNVTHEIAIGTAGIAGKGANTGFISPNGGGVYQGNNSAAWSITSDQRLKKNIVDNTDGLTAINGIKVRNFEYRLPDEITDLDKSNAVAITGVQLGPIAQELQQVLPDCVKTESTGVMSVDSNDVLWHLVTAVQQLSAQVTALQAKVGV